MISTEVKKIKRAIQSCENKIKHHYEHTHSKKSGAIKNEYTKIEALKKQIPRKTIKKNPICYSKPTVGEGLFIYDYYCPVCDAMLDLAEHHCPCGQALDWSSEK